MPTGQRIHTCLFWDSLLRAPYNDKCSTLLNERSSGMVIYSTEPQTLNPRDMMMLMESKTTSNDTIIVI